jgi:hypothetical protein
MRADEALALARQAGKGEHARVALSNAILANARKRRALRRAILASTTQENRDLFARFYGDGEGENACGEAWGLLFSIAGLSGTP